jgi:hypothetical protein
VKGRCAGSNQPNAHDALLEIKKIHGRGSRPNLPESQGEPAFGSKSVTAIRKARQHVLPITDHILLSAEELNKAFQGASGMRNVDIDLNSRSNVHRTVTAGRYDYDFDAHGRVLNKRLRKGAQPRLSDVGVRDIPMRGLNPKLETYRPEIATQVRAALEGQVGSNPISIFFPGITVQIPSIAAGVQ